MLRPRPRPIGVETVGKTGRARRLILCDAIANALDRLRQEMPGLTAEETAVVFETAVKVIRQSEGWPNRVASFGRILARSDQHD